jgi:hypothetical protein
MKDHFELAKGIGALFLSCVTIGACVGLALASAYVVVKLVVGVVQ